MIRSTLIAFACAISFAAHAIADSPKRLDIAAGELVTALESLSKQAAVELVYQPEQLKQYRTDGVRGTYEPQEAVRILLKGTPLELRTDPSGAMLIVSAHIESSAPSSPSDKRPDSGGKSDEDATRGGSNGGLDRSFRLAQVTSGQTQGSVSLAGSPRAATSDDSHDRLDEIVVTANKRAEPTSKIGEGISAISGEKLEQMNANNLEDYLSFIPGVAFTSYGRPGQDQITIRGIASQSLGSAVATYVDEVPVGSASNEAQGAVYTVDIDPADLQRVEVLKGPQGTLYGASSLGGVLKYVTKSPSLTDSELLTGLEANDIDHGGVGYKVRVAGTTPLIKDTLGLRMSAFYRDDAGYIDNVATGANNINSDTAWGLRVSLLYQPIEALQVKLGAMVQRTNSDGLDAVSYNAVPNFPPPFSPAFGDLNASLKLEQPSHVTDQIYTAEIHYDFGWANLISATGVSREDIYRFTDVTATYTRARYATLLDETPGSTVSDANTFDINKTTEELRLQSSNNENLEWLVGAFYQHETSTTGALLTLRNADGVEPVEPFGSPAVGATDNDLKEYAGFADVTWYIIPSVDVSAGYRRSRIEQHNFTDNRGFVYAPTDPIHPITRTDIATNDVNTYSAGARWRITDDLLFYVRAASGFRPGGGRGQPPVVIANFVTTYQPDSVWSYETGIKAKAFNGRFQIDLDGFKINWKNIQNLVDVGEGFLVQGNGGAAVSQGAETQIQVAPIRGLTLSAGFAYTDAHYTAPNEGLGLTVGEEIQFVPRTTASFQVEYQHSFAGAWKGLVGTDYLYRSSEMDAIGFVLPSYGQWGIHAGLNHNDTKINLYVVNLADSRGLLGYTGGGNSLGDAFRYAVNPPRTVGVSLTQKW
jgi:outer membrane receptor protein involved in Fe transport